MNTGCFAVAALATLAYGAQAVELVSGDGGRAVVEAYGGRLVSWQPKDAGEVFAMAWPYSQCRRGGQIHGGLPLYWPWFVYEGPEGCRIHGVTSYAEWKVKERAKSRVVMELDDNEETRAAWPHRFHAELEYVLSDAKLHAEFRVTNTDDEPYSCTEGFHPYFRLGDVRKCSISGTDGMRYFCKAESGLGDKRVWGGDFPCSVPYEKGVGYVLEEKSPEGKHGHVLTDIALGRRIEVVYEGNIKIVVWNSGEGFDKKFGPATDPDFARHYVCLEGATLYRDRAYVLKPGETHMLRAMIAVAQTGGLSFVPASDGMADGYCASNINYGIIQPKLVSE